jgi:hypothetical protein
MPEVALVFGPGVVGRAKSQHVHDLDITQSLRTFQKRMHKNFGCRAAFVDPNPIPGPDHSDGSLHAHQLLPKLVPPAHQHCAMQLFCQQIVYHQVIDL